MVRTQIQLTEEQARRLRAAAREQGVSLAEMIRRFVDCGLEEASAGRKEMYARAAALVGRFPDKEAARDLAEQHDRYLDEAYE